MSTFLMLAGILAVFFGLINLVYPVRRLGISSRRVAAYILVGGFLATIVGGATATPSVTPTPVSVAAS